MHERFRDALLRRWGRGVATHPRTTVAICLALAAACVVLTATRLEFRPDRSELVDVNLPWNQRYLNYKEQFPRWGDVVVVLEGEKDDSRIDALAREAATAAQALPGVLRADAGFDVSEAGPKLFMLAPKAQFERTVQELAQARQLDAAQNANQALSVLLAGLQREGGDEGSIDSLEQFLAPYFSAIASADSDPASKIDFSFLSPGAPRWQPLVSETGSGRLRFIRVQFEMTRQSVNDLGQRIAELRGAIRSAVAASDRPQTAFGITGIPAIEADETAQSVRDATIASIIATALIVGLMLIVYRGVVIPLLAMTALLIGMAWSFGWVVVSVGHLQVLSVVFTTILLGLGIDYAVLFMARLELIQNEHDRLPDAIERVFRGVGPGMLTGALTVAAAFGSTAFTDFAGMAEMGIIAGGGILLCVVAVLSSFPALIAMIGNWKRFVRHRPGGETAHFAHGWLDMFDGRPAATLIGGAVIITGLLWAARDVRYDPNIMNLQSEGVESVTWEQRIVADDARTIWAGLVITAPEQAVQQTRRLQDQPEIAEVGGMGMLFPRDLDQRKQAVAALAAQQIDPPSGEGGLEALATQLTAVRLGIALRGGSAPPVVKQRLTGITDAIGETVSAIRRMPQPLQQRAWERLDEAFIASRDQLGSWLEEALSPRDPQPEDLPPLLREQWLGLDGSWLLLVYPHADQAGRSVLEPDRLEAFVSALRAAAPDALGPPIQIYESSRVIIRSYTIAAGLALAVILIVVLLDFRSLADALCCIAPVTVGFIGAFGVMGLTDTPLNFANLIVMPLIFGIGVDASVNMVHRWRREPQGRPAGLSGGTGRGVTLAMLTTIFGFGSLLVSSHRGIWSLGLVMVAGLSITMLACYTMLPAILALRPGKVTETGPG